MELNLREIRKKKGMTQNELALAVGASKRQIGAWERGESNTETRRVELVKRHAIGIILA